MAGPNYLRKGLTLPMKQFLAPALLAGWALTLSSCSLGDKFGRLQPEVGMTIVQFASAKRAAIAGAPTLAGGVMVYAERADGFRAAFQLNDETDTRQFKLPNGSYKFTAVGWTATGLSGSAYCGYGGGANKSQQATFTLAGKDLDIPVTTATTTCADGNFADGDLLNSGTFSMPRFVFCGAGANLLTKTDPTHNCAGNGQESAVMLHGNLGAEGGKGVGLHAPTGRLVYTADLHAPNKPELFSVLLNGTGVVQQSGKVLTTGGGTGVKMADLVPGTNKIFFLAEETTAYQFTLFTSTVGQKGATRLLPGGFTQNVTWYRLSKNGSYLIFVAMNGSRADLYTARLTNGALAGAPTLHQPLSVTGGNGVSNSLTTNEPLVSFGPEVPGDAAQQKLAFIANFDGSNKKVYVTPVDIFSPIAQVMSENDDGMGGTYNTQATDLGFLPTGAGVAWIGMHTTTTGPTQVRLSRLSSVGTSELVSDVDTNSYFAVSPLADQIVYGKYDTAKTRLFLRTVTAGGGTDDQLYVPTNARNTDTFHGARFLPGNRLLIFGDGESAASGKFLLLGGKLIASGVTLMSDPTETTGTAPNGSPNVLQVTGDGHAWYLTDRTATGASANFEYFDALADPPVSVVTKIGTLAKGEANMGVMGNNLLFTDGAVPNQQASFYNVSNGITTPIDNGGKLARVRAPRALEYPAPAGYANAAFLLGGSASGPEDIYLKQDIFVAGAGNVAKLTRVDEPGGTGMFRVRMLPYHQGPGGAPVIDGEGIASACQSGRGGSYDGYAVNTSVKIPYGNVSNSTLFLTALDIYDGATCAGLPRRRIVEEGTRALANPAPTDDAKLTTGTSTATFFVRD